MSDIEVNQYGGKQSRLNVRYDLIPPQALDAVAHVLHNGAEKYGESNWKQITVGEHINHAVYHIYSHFADVEGEDHLAHAMVRLMFAYYVDQLGVVIPKNGTRNEDPTNQPSFEEAFYDFVDDEDKFHPVPNSQFPA